MPPYIIYMYHTHAIKIRFTLSVTRVNYFLSKFFFQNLISVKKMRYCNRNKSQNWAQTGNPLKIKNIFNRLSIKKKISVLKWMNKLLMKLKWQNSLEVRPFINQKCNFSHQSNAKGAGCLNYYLSWIPLRTISTENKSYKSNEFSNLTTQKLRQFIFSFQEIIGIQY